MEGFWAAFAALIVVAGPWKAAIVFAEKTVEMDQPARRRTALLTVLIATVVGFVVLAFGYALVELFHIKPAAFLIGAGLIVVVFAIRMVIMPTEHESVEAQDASHALRIAVYPLAIPMLLTPPAVASLTAIGIDAGLNTGLFLEAVAALLVVMLINLGAFLLLARYEHFVPLAVWDVAGRLLGIFLVAFGVGVIIDGFELIPG